MKKQWKLYNMSGRGWYIMWRWSDSKGTAYSNEIKGKYWKTVMGAIKWGTKHFGCASDNSK